MNAATPPVALFSVSRSAGRRAARPSFAGQRGGIILKLLTLLVLVAILGGLYLLRHPLLRVMGEFWVVDEPPQPSDAILVLDGDNYYGDRASRAAELYRAGWASRVVASGRYFRPYATSDQLVQHDLVDHGVPANAIIRLPNYGNNTREEALALRQLARERGWHRVLVVTSNHHTRRARLVYRHVFPADISFRMVSAPDSTYDPNAWWQSRLGLKTFFLETVGACVALWELRKDQSTQAPPGPPPPKPSTRSGSSVVGRSKATPIILRPRVPCSPSADASRRDPPRS